MSSLEASSTTTTSIAESNSRISSTTLPIAPDSFHAGTIATRRGKALPHTVTPAPSPTSSSNRRARCAYVCSSRTRSRARRPISSACPGSAISSRYAARASSALSTTTTSRPGLEPALDPLVRIRDNRRTRGGELEGTRGGRSGNLRVRPSCHVEVDPCGGDRAGKDVERDVAEHARRAHVPLEVEPTEPEVELRSEPRRLTHHRLHPVTPELVAVAVEEDVHVLLDGLGREELGIGAPVEHVGPTRAELEQTRYPAMGVRQHEVVLPRVCAVVRVEPGVHAPVLGQAHRDVAVVEDDRDSEPGTKCVGDASQMRHGNREDHHCVGSFALDQALEMAPPAGRHPPLDRLARQPIEPRLLRMRLVAPEIAVALDPRERIPDGPVRLALAVGRVRGHAPPGRLNRAPAVRRHDEIYARLVHPLPELPPGRRAAVAEIEVDGGRDCKDPRRLHGPWRARRASP